jgi:hypothetical protein
VAPVGVQRTGRELTVNRHAATVSGDFDGDSNAILPDSADAVSAIVPISEPLIDDFSNTRVANMPYSRDAVVEDALASVHMKHPTFLAGGFFQPIAWGQNSVAIF